MKTTAFVLNIQRTERCSAAGICAPKYSGTTTFTYVQAFRSRNKLIQEIQEFSDRETLENLVTAMLGAVLGSVAYFSIDSFSVKVVFQREHVLRNDDGTCPATPPTRTEKPPRISDARIFHEVSQRMFRRS